MNPLVSSAGATERSQLTEQLARKVDGNRDGQVTSAEFSSFLAGLMQSLNDELTSHRESNPATPPPATADASPTLLPLTDAAPLSRAQGAALLRQAFDTAAWSR